MAQVIKLKSSSVASAVPLVGDLIAGEIAINTFDGKVFLKKNDGAESIVEIGATVLDAVPTDGSTNGVESNGVFDALALKIDATEKAAANGIATLGADSKIPSAQLPAIAITDTFTVANEAAMLALTAQTGDVAVRTDTNETYILSGANPAVLGDWTKMLTPTDAVISVNSQTGAVVLTTSDISEGTNLYYTDARVLAYVGGVLNDAGTGTGDLWSAQKIQQVVDARLPNTLDIKDNITAIADPTNTDDLTANYSVGSLWVNANTDEAFICVDATTSTAVWVSITQSGGGTITGAANVGVAGVGVFKQNNAGSLEFKNINNTSTRLTITDDAANSEIDIDVNINDAGSTADDLWSANKISTRTIDGGSY